jgi:hypothetical protein
MAHRVIRPASAPGGVRDVIARNGRPWLFNDGTTA